VKKQILFDQHLSSSAPASTASTSAGSGEELKNETPEVFLGGSCNPTTWRADVAMPELKKQGISFYNPVIHDDNNLSKVIFYTK
jgi:hypothetical protein